MKLTSIFFLGLGMTAAMASGDSYLRANASSRQLRNSNQSSGEISHAMQRALGVFHLPHPSGGGGGGSDGGDDGGDDEGGRAYEESAEEKSWYSDSSTSSSAASGGADGADNGEDGIQEQYLTNEYNGGGAGNAQNAGGSSAANVWPFLAAALVVGVVAAALVTLKKVSLALCLYFPELFAFMSSCVLLTNVVVVYSSILNNRSVRNKLIQIIAQH